jgi:chromosome segregation ATPase
LQSEEEWQKKWQAAEQLAAKARERRMAAQHEMGTLEGRIAAALKEAEKAACEAANTKAEASELRQELARAHEAAAGVGLELTQSRSTWEAELAALRKEAAAMASAHSVASSKAAELERRLAAVEAARSTADAALEEARKRLGALRVDLEKRSQQITAMEASFRQTQACYCCLWDIFAAAAHRPPGVKKGGCRVRALKEGTGAA